MSIEQLEYGRLDDGTRVDQYTLTSAGGARAKIINYGGIITELWVPDAAGNLADIVLGKDSLGDYLSGHPYFGAIVGRVAGRITGGKFTLDGEEYQLAINNDGNHLHGGIEALDKKVWSAEALESPDGEPSLRLGYFSADGEEGYPGNLRLFVTYTMSRNNQLIIDYEAATDRPTPLSLTNHSYFNLAGHAAGSCVDHRVKIFADNIVPTDDNMTLLGTVEPVDANTNDLRQFKRLGDILPGLHQNHGDNYLINGGGLGKLVPVAEVQDPGSGRCMYVSATTASLQFYTSAMLEDGTTGKDGAIYNRFQALCFECQRYPDGVNSPEIEDIILRPGSKYQEQAVYAFATVRG